MTSSFQSLHAFLTDESGQDLVEYALVLAVIVCGSIFGLRSLAAALAAFPNEFINKFINAYNS